MKIPTNFKSVKLTSLLVILMMTSVTGFGKQIEQNDATTVASSFWNSLYPSKDISDFSVCYTFGMTVLNGQHLPAIYVVEVDGGGIVYVAGDDNVMPILGYSEKGSFNPKDIPVNFRKWMDNYKKQISFVVENNLSADEAIADQWRQYRTNDVKKPASTKAVNALLETKWNQDTYYNCMCPTDYSGPGGHVYAGCVACAMAQVMNFWEYPEHGTGFHSYNHSNYGTLSASFGQTTYNWDNMPNSLTGSSSTTQKQAIGTLMYQCGVGVEMDYSGSGSGAYIIESGNNACAEAALKSYFGYSSSLHGEQKSYYSNSGWINLLKSDLDASHPIIYGGYGNDGGHCFVCDGYNSNDYFHFNWGWSGNYDGYFSLTNLNPGTMSFTYGQQAIIGVVPGDGSGGGGGGGGGGSTGDEDLRLYSSINMSETEIWFGDEISATVSIANYGESDYTGYFGAAVFNEEGAFVDFIEYGSYSLPSDYYNTYTFRVSGSTIFVPGQYYLAIFSAPSVDNTWSQINGGNYTNLVQFEIYYYAGIETYSDFTVTTNNGSLIQGKSATINVDFLNYESETFYGKVRVSLSVPGGGWSQNVGIVEVSNGLPYGYHYTDGVNFTGNITVEPGTYLLELAYMYPNSSVWYYAGSRYKSNPVYVIVEAAPYTPDSYESNNTVGTASVLSLSFSNNSATVSTTGSNLHNSSDIDYYKIALPSGYDYLVVPRLYDSYNSGSGSYTVDALFSYSTDNGSTWSDAVDDEMPGSILNENGGTVYFKVSSYNDGGVGTYLLSINVSRATHDSSRHSISASCSSNGSISPSGLVKVTNGGSQKFTISPNKGYLIGDVLVDNVSVGAVSTYTFNNVTTSHTFYASFVLNEGIDDNEDDAVKVYPNPANDVLRIDCRNMVSLTVSNPSGQIMISEGNLSGYKELDVSGFKAGVYILRMKLKDGCTITKEIVVTH